MTSRFFIQALFVALTAMPVAQAAMDRPAAGASGVEASDHAVDAGDAVVVPDAVEPAPAPAEESASPGGAVFSPFAEAPREPEHRDAEQAWYLNMDGADLTFTAMAALAGLAAFAYLMRRAWR